MSRYSAASSSWFDAHHLDVSHVLPGQLGHRNIQDVQVLTADQIQEQIERPLERLEENLEGIRRNEEVVRKLQDRLTTHFPDRRRVLALSRFNWLRHKLPLNSA